MRLHRLQVVAFGPFADRVEVDFDALSDAGLFLLTGATGAGKTSVLDAVCFALYGAVPGDRQSAKRLRSDHAAPGVAPEVSLEFGVAGRRFRIRRSPAWERPRKRGAGTTRAQPGVVLDERVEDAWQTRATRLDDAGHFVSGLLGMTLNQFCQVQLLPQGRFQAFLRAESDERHRLLQRLFRTARFEDVEHWLRERRRGLRRRSADHHDLVAAVVSRVSEASGSPLPEGWDLHDLGLSLAQVTPWASDVHAAAVTATRRAEAALAAAATAEATSRGDLERARAVAERQERHQLALSQRSRLTAAEPAHLAQVRGLAAARRAALVAPLHEELDRALTAAETAHDRARGAARRAREELDRPECPVAELEAAGEQASAAAAAARAQLPRVREQAGLDESISSLTRQRLEVTTRLSGLEGRAAALPGELADARAAEAAAAHAAGALPGARQALETASRRLEAGRLVARLTADKAEAQARHRSAVDAAQAAREHWLQVQERRIEGMAAEIAGGLAVGACCPVCGSADHPQPARPAAGSPDAHAEREARAAVDDAEAERHVRLLAVGDLETRIVGASERSGHADVLLLEQEHGATDQTFAQLEARAALRAGTTRDRSRLEEELGGVVELRTRLVAELARLDATIEDQATRAAALADEVAALLEGTGHADVASLAGHLDTVAASCREAARSTVVHEQAQSAVAEARERASARAVEQGFADLDEARAAALPPQVLGSLEREIQSHAAAVAAVQTTLDDPELRAAAALTDPDLEALSQALARAEQDLAASHTTASLSRHRSHRLGGLTGELAEALAVWEPLRAELDLTERLASLTDGTSPDNTLRMRLSAYVLAFRLAQVVDAANERLARMFDHRYSLEHTGARGVGESRGGLSLRVRDDWSGESRDPATLSGGETFVVSLALALGLADVIAHEAGGSELDTLFVDEGFGTLDAETLDQVLDTLDSLRDGGRVVGVVSHVAEMRMRIPTQLHVRKQRTGSTLSQGA